MDDLKKLLFKTEIDQENLIFKCANCKNCLSVSPVVYNSLYTYMCGRRDCVNLAAKDGTNSTQFLYHSIAKFLKFPCMYRHDGCMQELAWGEVQQHEENCNFMHYRCPFFTESTQGIVECAWLGEYSEFLHHLETSHPEHEFLNPKVLDDLSDSRIRMYYLNVRRTLVLISLYIDLQRKLYFKLWADMSIRGDLVCHLRFYNKNGSNSICSETRVAEEMRRNILREILVENCLTVDLGVFGNRLKDIYYFTLVLRLDNVDVEIKDGFF